MKLNYYLILLFSLFLSGCTEDKIIPEDPSFGIDNYEGVHNMVSFTKETAEFLSGDLVIHIKTPDGLVIQRKGKHQRISNTSRFTMEKGLKEGKYQFLYLEYIVRSDCSNIDGLKRAFGLGCRIEVNGSGISVTDTYNDQINLWGKGTKEEPYKITTAGDLEKIREAIIDAKGNTTSSTYFEQQCDIDMSNYNDVCGWDGNWYQIGLTSTYPFTGYYNGNGHKIINLFMNDTKAVGASLFGFVNNAYITNLIIEGANITGYCGVSAIAGIITSKGNSLNETCIRGCEVINSTIKGRSDGIGVGGIVGSSDPDTKLWVDSCFIKDNSSITGAFGIGGILGGATALSVTQITNCVNKGGSVEAYFNNAGGIIGYADTLKVLSCVNKAKVYGATGSREMLAGLPAESIVDVGTGGIIGGCGISSVVACRNEGEVQGKRGVGGIIGSTLVSTTPLTCYNDVFTGYCSNTALINGDSYVGGLCGEAQYSSYKSYNNGNVKGTNYVGGILGSAPVASICNTINFATITAQTICGGIAGEIIIGAAALNINLGDVASVGDFAGGMMGRVGNSFIMNYCANFANITGNHSIGGLIGKVGNAREWTKQDTRAIILAVAEAGVSVASTLVGGAVGGIVGKIGSIGKIGTFLSGLPFLVIDGAVLLYDWGMTGINIVSFFLSPEKISLLSASLKTILAADMSELDLEMNSLLQAKLNASILASPTDIKSVNTFMLNRDELIRWYESQQNNQKFKDSMNSRRDKIYQAEVKAEQAIHIAHSLINGVCLLASSAAFVGSLIVSIPGTPAAGAVVMGVAGLFITTVSFTNSIISVFDQFEKNAVIATQCISFGSIKGNENTSTGGLIGRMEDATQISDCLNGSSSPTQTGGAITGHLAKRTVITRCLNIGSTWWQYSGFSHTLDIINFSINDSYCWNNTTKKGMPQIDDNGQPKDLVTTISKDQSRKESTFRHWDFNKLWSIPVTDSGGYPIPYKSEMQY